MNAIRGVRRRVVSGDPIDAAVRAEAGGVIDDAVFATLRQDAAAQLIGAGPLEPLLATAGVTDVLVNAPDQVWIDRGHGLERTAVRFPDDAAVRALAQRLAASAGRRLDDACPFVDAGLPDGTRLHAVLPPLVVHPTVSLRVLARRHLALTELGLSPPVVAMLADVVAERRAFVISGGTGTGKTTLLAALLGEVPSHERIVVIEDAPELDVHHPHVVRMVPRPANVEGAGEIGLRALVRNALRMRPDRLVVGEFRGAEMVDLLVALNTGHEGGAATVHANSAADVPSRLRALGLLGGIGSDAVAALAASAIELVVHLRRTGQGRQVSEIARLESVGSELVTRPLWSADAPERGAGP